MSMRTKAVLAIMLILFACAAANFVAVTVLTRGYPQVDVQKGLLVISALLLTAGTVAAVFLAPVIARPPYKIEEENGQVEELHDTVRIQASQLREEHRRIKIMLNATPISCRLWNREFKVFECNAVAVRTFCMETGKCDPCERIFDHFPEYQPDGRPSRETAIALLQRAFDGERCIFEWTYQMPDGSLVPSEVTLVRVRYGEDYAVASYIRDLREHKRIMSEIERRDALLDTVNQVATLLLTTTDNTGFEELLLESLALIGQHTDVDRVQIWQNETIDGALHFVHKYQWLSEIGQQKPLFPIGTCSPYDKHPGWYDQFSRGKHINGTLHGLSESEQAFLGAYAIESIVIIPLFLQMRFWGILCLDDCHKERVFTEEEVGILRSAGLMLISALNSQMLVAQIQAEHERTKLFLDAMPFSCCLWDENLQLFDCNDEMLKLLKFQDRQEFLDRFHERSPKFQSDGQLSVDKESAYLQRTLKGGRHTCEWEHQLPDGTQIPVEATLVRITHGNSYAVAGYVRDLREQKRMIAEIERRDYLLDVINQAAAILLESDLDDFKDDLLRCMGMIAEAVDVDRICIWKNSTVNARHCHSLLYDWARDENPRQHIIATTNVPYEETIPGWRVILASGNCITGLVRDMAPIVQSRLKPQGIVSLFVLPIFLRDQFWGYIGYDECQNEREFLESEQSILHSAGMLLANAIFRNEMTKRIRTYAVQLEAALEQARNANRAKSDFLAHMSHEMRTPLNAVIGLSGLTLESERLGKDPRSNLEKIYNAGTTLLCTVNDILDISKIEAGKLMLHPDEYDVSSLINDAVTQSILQIKSKPIEFILDLDENLPSRLYGDELRVKQIFSNLLSNAFKYTREGTVSLSVAGTKEEDDVWLTISVRDTGIGIRSDDLPQLFTNYTRFNTELNRDTEGTGLGLPITKQLAEMMAGAIDVQSEYEKGSLFTVRILQKVVGDEPIGQEAVENLKNFRYSFSKHDVSVQTSRVQIGYARVLVVDDIPTNLDVAKGMLKPYGMRIDCATNGREAVAAIREGRVMYDAVFMDHMMPEMDGMEAARLIREIETEYAQNLPIIALTANAVVGSEKMFLDNGFQAFLSKPIDPGRLDDVIRHWIHDRKDRPSDGSAEFDEQKLPNMRSGRDRRTQRQRRGSKERRQGIDRRHVAKRIPGIDVSRGMRRFGSNWEVFLDILRSYARSTRSLLEVAKAVTQDNLAEYAITVHGVKGSSRGIYANDVADRAEALENAAKAGDIDFVNEHNAAFIEVASRLVVDIEFMISGIDAAKPKKEKPDEETLAALSLACEKYDMDGVDAAMKEIDSYEYASDDGLVAWLRENIDKMNFEQIQERLNPET